MIFVFYDLFYELCLKKGVTPSKACLDMGLSRSLAAKWKNTKATPSADVMSKISDYFGVSTDYLLGKEVQKEKSPSARGERGLDFDAFTYAMYEEGKELTEENKAKLLEMAKFFRQQQEKEKP